MAKKYIPTPEELNNIMTLYGIYGSYAKTADACGHSVATITRIIKENIGKLNQTESPISILDVSNITPKVPTKEDLLSFWCPEPSWVKNYEEY